MKVSEPSENVTEEGSVKSDEDITSQLSNNCQETPSDSVQGTDAHNRQLIKQLIDKFGEYNLYKSSFASKITGGRAKRGLPQRMRFRRGRSV